MTITNLINMITLSFKYQNEFVYFVIKERVVAYFDKILANGIQIYPRNETLIKTLQQSRSPIMRKYGELIIDANQGKNLLEYQSCQTEEDLAEMIRNDCRSKGLVEIKNG